MNRPKYLWTLFFAFQGIVFALCYLFQVQGIPDDLWLIALAYISVCMVIGSLETGLAMTADIPRITSHGDFDADFPFNHKELS